MELEKKRRTGEVEEVAREVTLQRKASIKAVDRAMEKERARRLHPVLEGIKPMLVFGLSVAALAALLAITFEDKARDLFFTPPPPPPPRGMFGLF